MNYSLIIFCLIVFSFAIMMVRDPDTRFVANLIWGQIEDAVLGDSSIWLVRKSTLRKLGWVEAEKGKWVLGLDAKELAKKSEEFESAR